MRGLLTLAAILLALTSVNLTGNFFRIRAFLVAHLVATFFTEIFLAWGGDIASSTYFWLYVLTALPILITAVLIAGRMVSKVPDPLRVHYIAVPVIMAIIAYYLTPFAMTFSGVFLAIQGCVLMVCGMQASAAAELDVPAARLAHKTLGMLWMLQAIMFFLYSCGVQFSPTGWEHIGTWLPALLVSGAMLKLAWDFQKASQLT